MFLVMIFIVIFVTIVLCKTLSINFNKLTPKKNDEVINFIHIPKNAGTSMEIVCKKSLHKIVYHFHGVNVFDKNIKNQLVIIQNPIKRFCSAVYYALNIWKHIPEIKFLIEHDVNTVNKWVEIWSDKTHRYHDNLMEELLNKQHHIGNKFLEYKWIYTPQSEYINNPKYVILLENIDSEMKILLNMLKLDIDIPIKNKSKHKNDNISDKNILFLENFYKTDIEMYNKYKNMSLEARLI